MRWHFALVAGGLACPIGLAGAGDPFVRVWLQGPARVALVQAIDGAVRRLERADCRQVLSDFKDSEGRTLRSKLDSLQKSPREYAMDLWFVDGSLQPQCTRRLVTAFTMVESRVVFVCGLRFAHLLTATAAQIVVIHEILHTLGLKENPPTSLQITDRVTRRCVIGDS